MTTTIVPNRKQPGTSGDGASALQDILQREGRMPSVRLIIKPLDGRDAITLKDFISYNFSSSIMVPVDQFTFTFAAPDALPFYELVKEGDMASLEANGVTVCTGIIDTIEIGIDGDGGEMVTVTGRDLLAQFEDQDAVSVQDAPIWANRISILSAVKTLAQNTKVQLFELRDAPSGGYLFATEPGETKISALQRMVEPLNCIFWMRGDGALVIGKPNMRQGPAGDIIVSKERRFSNVTSIKVIRSSTQLPNVILPIWSGQETVQDRVSVGQRVYNAAQGALRLFKLGYQVPKAVVVSTPSGGDAQSLAQQTIIETANGNRVSQDTFTLITPDGNSSAAGSTILQAYAKRAIARANFKEIIVQCTLPGHYNDNGQPFQVDTCYNVLYDRGSLEEKMYLFQVEYSMDNGGQRSQLFFCRLGSIVADVRER